MSRQSRNMIKYIAKRILLMFPILIAVLIFTWILSNNMAINPELNQIGGNVMDRARYEAELRRSGFWDPWYVKLGIYLGRFFIGDWGESFVFAEGTSVIRLISEIFPKTIELMIFSIIIVPIIAVKFGVTAAKHKDKPRDTAIRGMAILGAGFPIFYIAILLQLFVGINLKTFTHNIIDIEVVYPNNPVLDSPIPPWGVGTGFRLIDSLLYNDQIYLWDTVIHLVLPVFCMIFVSLSGVTRQTRSSMLGVLDQDFIRTARAKGVVEKDVINKHALRNAILPTSHLVIAGTAGALLGSLFVEVTFNYTGFGYVMYMSIILGDYLVINGLLVFSTIVIISGTLIADVAYTIIDPRIMY
ncbi:MAG: ABC transporter permease [Candidatus Lokiarchaeota archaeon]|nr:ABC transporter permease [Candidatus Lokiarchaeota archaeon]